MRLVITLLLLSHSISANAVLISEADPSDVFVFESDTESELRGTFSITGFSFAVDEAVNFAPLLPFSVPFLIVNRETPVLSFFASGVGEPDSPFAQFNRSSQDGIESFPDISGIFNNNPSMTDVSFSFSNLQDTGGADGVFSGRFDFALGTSFPPDEPAITVAEPGALDLIFLALLLIGLRKLLQSFGVAGIRYAASNGATAQT